MIFGGRIFFKRVLVKSQKTCSACTQREKGRFSCSFNKSGLKSSYIKNVQNFYNQRHTNENSEYYLLSITVENFEIWITPSVGRAVGRGSPDLLLGGHRWIQILPVSFQNPSLIMSRLCSESFNTFPH